MIFEVLLFDLLRSNLVIFVFPFIKSVEFIKIIIEEVNSVNLLRLDYQWCLGYLLRINDPTHWRDLALHIWFVRPLLVIHEVVLSSEVLA